MSTHIKNFFYWMLITGISISFCGCATDSKSPSTTTLTTNPQKNVSSPTLKPYYFHTSDEVQNLPDKDLIEIAQNPYQTEDFFQNEEYTSIDYFDIPLVVPNEDNENSPRESVYIMICPTQKKEHTVNMSKPISSKTIRKKVEKDIRKFLQAATRKEPDEETGAVAKNKETIFCGENSDYVEYSVRYTDERTYYKNQELTTLEIPRAYRRIYLKNILSITDNKSSKFFLLGTLNADYACRQLDYWNSNKIGKIIYREITENKTSYTYLYYNVYIVGGDYGLNDTAHLCRSAININKSTHEISWGETTEIKSVEIAGTAKYAD